MIKIHFNFLSFVLSFALSFISSIHAETLRAKVYFEEFERPLNCHKEKSSHSYYCHNGDKVILIKNQFHNDYNAIGNWKDPYITEYFSVNKIEIFSPKKNSYVEAFIKATPYINDQSFLSLEPKSLIRDRNLKIINHRNFHRNFNNRKMTKGYKKALEILSENINRDIKRTNDEIQDSSYEVTTLDNKEFKCQRFNEVEASESSQQLSSGCNYFICDKASTRLLIDEENGTPYIFNFTEDGPKSLGAIKSIVNSKNTSLFSVEHLLPYIKKNSSSQKEGTNNEFFPSLKQKRLKYFLNFINRPNLELMENSIFERCQPNAKIEYEKAKNLFTQTLNNLELVQIIEGDVSFISKFIEREQLSIDYCRENNVFYENSQVWKNNKKIKQIYKKGIENTITPEQARELFKKSRERTDIAWDYKNDGCYARAHLMALDFEKQGIYVEKAWVGGDLKVFDKKNKPIAEWYYHVAPIVYVKNDNGLIVRTVIDPSIEEGPVSLEAWINKMNSHNKTIIQRTDFPLPLNASVAGRTVYTFSNSDVYLPKTSIEDSKKSKEREAKEVMENYTWRPSNYY